MESTPRQISAVVPKTDTVQELSQVNGKRLRLFRIRRFLVFVSGAALALTVLALCLPAARTHILIWAGQQLVGPQPPVTTADIIVVAIDAKGAGTLEAADLVHRGISTRVAVFDDPPSTADKEFIRRGLPYEDRAAISVAQLHSLGLQNVEVIPRSTSGSEQEGDILPVWCDRQGYHSVVLVTSSDHSRRLSRILRRSAHCQDIRITVRRSVYSTFNPNAWWHSRDSVRSGITELEKLLLDFVRHPFS